MKEGLRCHLASAFFGLTPTYKISLHKEIFSLAYHSQGAFDQQIVYNLPVYLRRFYLNELKLAKEEERKQMDKNQDSSPKSNLPRGPFSK